MTSIRGQCTIKALPTGRGLRDTQLGAGGARDGRPALLVAGDGAAWPAMSAAGLLDGAGPVRYTADLDARTLDRLLEEGSRLVVTDTNRRREESIPLEQWRGGPGTR